MKDFFADHRPVVMTPAGDNRVELPDQVLLPCRFRATNGLGQWPIVTLDRVFAGFDERLEAASLGGVVFAGRVLANLKPEEAKARLAFFWMQGVSDAGFRRAQFQADVG